MSKVIDDVGKSPSRKSGYTGSKRAIKLYKECMKKAKRMCPKDFQAQLICGQCQNEEEEKCRVYLFMDTGVGIATPWWW